MKKVRFENGKFGLRRWWWFGWHYEDLVTYGYRWPAGHRFFPDCMGSEDTVDRVHVNISGKHEVVT